LPLDWPIGEEGNALYTGYVLLLSAVSLAGLALWLVNCSRAWHVAGTCLVVGGAMVIPAFAEPLPCQGYVCDDTGTVARALEGVGLCLIALGAGAVLVALGGRGRRRFLTVWAVAAAIFVVGGYLDSTFPAGYSPGDRCADEGFGFLRWEIERWPPGVRCFDQQGASDFEPAHFTDGLMLAGYSLLQGFLLAFPLLGAVTAVRHWIPSHRRTAARPR
jgi:hypothetical protein